MIKNLVQVHTVLHEEKKPKEIEAVAHVTNYRNIILVSGIIIENKC